jgi:transposase
MFGAMIPRVAKGKTTLKGGKAMGQARAAQLAVPEETARVARMAFPKGNPYMRMRDELGVIFQEKEYADLLSEHGRPAESLGGLALVTLMQFAEGLSDRQAADAVRARIDWKYALGLTLTDAGFDYSVLSEFRRRLLAHGAAARVFEGLLVRLEAAQLLTGHRKQRTDSTHIVAAVQEVNRLEMVASTLRHALESLAEANGRWLQAHVPADVLDLHGPRLQEYRLPKDKGEREALAERIGADGMALLDALRTDPTAPRGLTAVETLRQIWVQQFWVDQQGVHWRPRDTLAPGDQLIHSPFDLEARWSCKRSVGWLGYKVHFTETCDSQAPRLITNVQTTPATTTDIEVLDGIQDQLVAAGRAPEEHIVDSGYVDAGQLVRSQERGIALIGPAPSDTSWQAKTADGYDLTTFDIDWQRQRATCPEGQTSTFWSQSHDTHGNAVVHVAFPPQACAACPARARCTRAKGPRRLKLRPQIEHEALVHARAVQTTEAFRERYRPRAGVEATFSLGAHSFDLRRSRYLGLAKTHQQHLFIAAAMNFTRSAYWLAGRRPARTRQPLLSTRLARAV